MHGPHKSIGIPCCLRNDLFSLSIPCIFIMQRTGTLASLAIMATGFQRALASEWTGWTGTELQAYATSYLPYGCNPEVLTGTRSCSKTYGLRRFTVKHTNIPTGVTPAFSIAITNIDWDIVMSTIVLPTDAIPRSELEDWSQLPSPSTRSQFTTDLWIIDHILTAPASCPTPFEFTTSTSLQPWAGWFPSEFLTEYMLPKATVLPVQTHSTKGYNPSLVREIHVKPTDLPPTRHGGPHARTYYDSVVSSLNTTYVQECHRPGGPRPLTQEERCPYTYAGKCSKVEPWKVIIATVIPSVFLLGFVENFFWFGRLMMGRTALRLGTVCWILIFIFTIGFTIVEDARKPEDQSELREQWKAMPLKMKIKLWFQFGFRQRYPVDWLGERKPRRHGENIETERRGDTGGGNGGAGTGGRRVEDDTPLPVYPGPPSSVVGGTTAASSGPVLGNPNAVLASMGSGTVVISPMQTSVQTQSPVSLQRPDPNTGTAGDGFRAV
ncbi:uncharacterized protein PODANS_6_2350 [Podospora anserina S mat+]|uniref:Podospora anserina S mat+ genomic DNA chromosome 6, supercontig 2 n=1 Tax=Podospora anserina (strain S / ATCC MYA-4624 / DSM 980 / FGSC 10383) TaxID=515849 RepID=B2B2R1_PODAN|nr:uncharacterized protein PODANS_6_2350 [Podospora anserina S mat+]CAP71396.1 unnamed protein product [Podospora anserina S mat+]CDP30796.1 Putative protein of unknown function [Podospora anserina S mat+]